MPSFSYRAIHQSGRISRGSMNAANENELVHTLKQSGLELITAREIHETMGLDFLSRRKRIPARALAAFCSRMHDLLRTNIAFPDAIRDVQTTTENRVLADALAQISQSIANGKGISASFALYPHLFPNVVTAIIAAGERSGNMGVIFDYLARYTESTALTQERLRRALRYPLFLFLVAGGASTFMMAMVIPQVIQFLNGIDGKLPLATRILVFTSTLFVDFGAYILAAIAAVSFLIFCAAKSFPTVALFIDRALLRLPVIGNVIAKTSLARFTHSFVLLFRSGCDVPQCLRQSGDTVSNKFLRARIEDAERDIAAGASLSAALNDVLPSYAIGILRIGERSGDLGKSLDDITKTYDREAADAIDGFIGLLEPGLTLLIGGILAWTVIAVLGPLYGSLSVLGRRM